jgi:Protein of unknown function (DUF1592)/Protein of unknown function (DUF1588)/Protein of unknown function (DUF1595)/Protein of unknown function (DUF1585)/Protein of unknown function (DUF1587)
VRVRNSSRFLRSIAELGRLPRVAVLLGLLGCQGNVGGGPQAPDRGGASSAPGPASLPEGNATSAPEAALAAGRAPLRRLGKSELLHTLHDLLPQLAADFDTQVELPADNEVALAFALPGSVSDLEVKRFMELAETALSALGTRADQLTLCSQQDENACARSFITTFGKRAFRRPLAPVEVDDLMALYAKLRSDPALPYEPGPARAVLVQAMLQAPGFLYRWERGLAAPLSDGTLIKLDDYELASRLSYFLWGSMPDATLFAAADAGALHTPDQVAAQAERLLRDPRADESLADFIRQWLELGALPELIKDASFYPAFAPELRAAMQEETTRFARDVLRGPSPTFENLLTARYTFVDAALARYYGVKPDAQGRVDLAGSPRLGLLTQGALLAVKGNSYRTSPVRRGKFVLNRLLCKSVPPPPPNVVPELPPPDPTRTLREQMAMHRDTPACAACHTSMDALGFAFEHFDGAGHYREAENGQPIDASGNVQLAAGTLAFRNAEELVRGLAASPEAQACFARQWLRFALDRFEQPEEESAALRLSRSYLDSGRDTRALLLDIVRSLPFTHRAPAEGEELTP